MLCYSIDELIANIRTVIDKAQEVGAYVYNNGDKFQPSSLIDQNKNIELLSTLYNIWLQTPESFADINMQYTYKLQLLIFEYVSKFIGQNIDLSHFYLKPDSDKRFQDKIWHEGIFFDFSKQCYLLFSEWLNQIVERCNLDAESKQYIKFIIKKFTECLSPTNSILFNPLVLKESLDTGFTNIISGLDRFLQDLKKSGTIFTIPTVSDASFKVGENIANTKGKIVYQNDLMQLICYEPKDQAFGTPLLIIPPWINKYYILDLSEKNSFVKFLVNNNIQVFMISWINPDATLANKDFEDYLKDGVIAASNFLNKLGYKKFNALGYCIGGTLLGIATAYNKFQGIHCINTITMLNTLLDFENVGEIGVLINENSIKAIEYEMQSKGFLDGRYLSNSFSLLRSNDLIWPVFVNNYLLGKPLPALDLLYWNSDYTNLPAKMHSYYLRNMYLHNLLKEKNALSMLKVPIDLGLIDVESFFVASMQDHIAPWKSVYQGAQLMKGKKSFCLSSSGHIAGIVHSQSNPKNSYRISDQIFETADGWYNKTFATNGSWWGSFIDWLKGRSGSLTKPIKYNKMPCIEEAPGAYVKLHHT